jgi:hypothetical protein
LGVFLDTVICTQTCRFGTILFKKIPLSLYSTLRIAIVMKLNTTTLVLGIALTVVAGLFSSTIFGLTGTKNDAQTTTAAGLITGHVITTVRDAAGNIKEYRQSDNQIVNQGENCVAKMLFSGSGGSATGTNVCVGQNTDGFRYIEIGNSTQAVTSADYKLGNPHNATSFGSGSSLIIKAGTVNWFANSTGSGSGTTTDTRISATFQNSAPNPQTVSESGLFNSTNHNTNALFARQTFGTITLNNGDQLTVEWRINIGGTASSLTP